MLIEYTYISNLKLHSWIYRLQVQKLSDDSDIYIYMCVLTSQRINYKKRKGPESRFFLTNH